MSWLEALIRKDLRGLAAYSSARAEGEGFVPTIAIDANESPWPPFGRFGALTPVNRYPEPQPKTLIARLAAAWNVAPRRVLLGRGSDEGIDLLLRLFCAAGEDEILICPPTFGMYKVYAAVQGARVLAVPLTDEGHIDVAACLDACTPHTKLIFIPSPNAPMGHPMRRADIAALCAARAGKSLIVVDEAYVGFSDTPDGLAPDLDAFPNLVLLRTLSKFHALAGERIGAVIAGEDIVTALGKVISPYPLTQTSIQAALDAVGPNGLLQADERRKTILAERARMERLLVTSPLVEHVYPSQANFLLVRATSAAALMNRLRGYGILARDRSSEIPNAVRLTVSSAEENDLVLKALGVEGARASVPQRLFSAQRRTKETEIGVTVNLDAPSFLKIDTGIGFFDHMLAQLASHGGFGLALECRGDLHIDQHHTVEDCALALGTALKGALGDKRGIARFGFHAPLDEAVAQVVIDLSGRPYAAFTGTFPAAAVGGLSTEMVPHFFQSLATALPAAVHITVTGDNAHHMVEAAFKAVGRSFRAAFQKEGQGIPSTKGVL